MHEARRRLLCNGMFLFLLGLVTGLVEAPFTNPRMGLAAHLEGIMNGLSILIGDPSGIRLPDFHQQTGALVSALPSRIPFGSTCATHLVSVPSPGTIDCLPSLRSLSLYVHSPCCDLPYRPGQPFRWKRQFGGYLAFTF